MGFSRERIASAAAAGLLTLSTLASGASRASAQEAEPGILVRQECFTPGNYGTAIVEVGNPKRFNTDVSIIVSGVNRSDFTAGQAIDTMKFDLNGRPVIPGEESPKISVHRTSKLTDNPTQQSLRESLVMSSVSLGKCEEVGNTIMPVGFTQNNESVSPLVSEGVFPPTAEPQSIAPNSADIVPGTFLKTCHPDGTTQIDYFPTSTDPIVVGGFELDEHGVRRGSEKGYTSEQIASGEIVNVYLGNAQGARKVRATVLKGQVPEVSATDPLFSQSHAPVAVIDLDPC